MVSNDLIRVEGDRRFDLIRKLGDGVIRGQIEKDRGKVWDVPRVSRVEVEKYIFRKKTELGVGDGGGSGKGGGGGGRRGLEVIGEEGGGSRGRGEEGKLNTSFGESEYGRVRTSVSDGVGLIDKKSELEFAFGVF